MIISGYLIGLWFRTKRIEYVINCLLVIEGIMGGLDQQRSVTITQKCAVKINDAIGYYYAFNWHACVTDILRVVTDNRIGFSLYWQF